MHVVAVRQHRDGERGSRCAGRTGSSRGCARRRGRAAPGSRAGSRRRSRSCGSASASSRRATRSAGPTTRPASPSAAPTAVSRFADCSRSCTSSNSARRSCAGWIGTRTRAGTKRLVGVSPRSRVLIGIASRSSSTALPQRSWYRPSALAKPVTNTSLMLPPSLRRGGAQRLERRARWISKWRRSERPVITSERAGSVTSAWRWSEREQAGGVGRAARHLGRMRDDVAGGPDRAAHGVDAALRGVDHGVCASPRAEWSGSRAPVVGASSGACGSGSRSKSTSASESFRPPTPSVIVWWIFWSSAARPSARPSMSVNSHSGRARSSGCSASAPQRSSSARSSPGAGTRDDADVGVEVEGRVVGELRAARCAAARRRRVGAGGGSRRARAASCRGSAIVGRAPIEDRQVAEVGPERGVLLDRPHDRFGVRHPHGAERTAPAMSFTAQRSSATSGPRTSRSSTDRENRTRRVRHYAR